MVTAAAALLAGCDSASSQSYPALTSSSSESASPLSGCQDATCEVEVKAGDKLAIDEKFRVETITVIAVGEDEITLSLTGSSGRLIVQGRDVSSSVSCVNDSCTDTGELTVTTDSPGRINDVGVSLISTDNGRAVLKLAPR